MVFALRRKYAQLKGVLKYDPTNDPEGTVQACNQVGCVLRMFAPELDLSAIVPVRPYKGERDRWSLTAIDILRRSAQPMTARALARAVLDAKGIEPGVDVLMSVECSLHAVLERLEGAGIVRLDGAPKRWMVAP